MGLLTFIRGLVGGKVTDIPSGDTEFFHLAGEVAIRELAFQSAVSLIGGAMGACEMRTFLNGDSVRKGEHYLWNVRPNANQSASELMNRWVYQLYRTNKALIVEVDGQLVVADDFSIVPSVLKGNTFEGVTVGALTFRRTFAADEVMFFSLNSQDINRLLALLYQSYGKLLSYSVDSFQKSRGTKGKLTIDTNALPGLPPEKREERIQKLLGTDIQTFLKSNNAVLPLYSGITYEEVGARTYNSDTSRDIRALYDDIFDFTARAFRIPPPLLRGDVAETGQTVANLLTFCIDPLAKMLSQEATAKRCGKSGYLQGTYLRMDTSGVRHADMLDSAVAIDKLIGSGGFCVNDILARMGEPTIDEPWARQHFMTKNYQPIQTAMTVKPKGGETT